MNAPHSDLKEWLSLLDPLPWMFNQSTLIADSGVVPLGEFEPSRRLNREQAEAVRDYIVHCCNTLPPLVRAIEPFIESVREARDLPDAGIPFQHWNDLWDALRLAKGEGPSAPEPTTDLVPLTGVMGELADAIAKLARIAEGADKRLARLENLCGWSGPFPKKPE